MYENSNRQEATHRPGKADSASAKELQAAVTKTREVFGLLDAFVSNAGILTLGTIDGYSLEDFDHTVAIMAPNGRTTRVAGAGEQP